MTHYCRCTHCDPDMLPSGDTRISEGHVAVRFGDQRKFGITYEGEDISNQVFEALAGRDGWVIRWAGRYCHTCRTCGEFICAVRQYGNVGIRSLEVVA